MNKIWSWLSGDVFKALGGVVDDLFTSDEERLHARNQILKVLTEKGAELDKIKADIIQTEAKGNWLQRSWRPILMLSFGFIVMYSKFIAPAFGLPNTILEPEFWSLLKLGIGGYVIGRSAEKIIKDVSNKIEFKPRRNGTK